MVLKMRNRLESLATIRVSASERSDAVSMSQQMVLAVLFLLE